jgi:hypothetical protein
MILLGKIISYIGLGLTVVPSFLLLSDGFEDIQYQMLATVGMVLWFVTAPFWINRTKEEEA